VKYQPALSNNLSSSFGDGGEDGLMDAFSEFDALLVDGARAVPSSESWLNRDR
jgi:hypothetical protein